MSKFYILLLGTLFVHRIEASFHLRTAPESGDLRGKEFEPATSPKHFRSVDFWFLAEHMAIFILITVTLVVGLCVCIKFGEGKQAEQWGQWGKCQEGDEDTKKKWDKIEEKMQKTDVVSYVEATDYQQLLKNVSQKVARERAYENSKSGAVQSFLAKTLHLNDMNSAAPAVLQSMPVQEAVHWLQLQPKAFNSGAAA